MDEKAKQHLGGAALAAGRVTLCAGWEVVSGWIFIWVMARRLALPLLHRSTCQTAPEPLWVRCWLSHSRKPRGARALLCGLFWAQTLPLGFFGLQRGASLSRRYPLTDGKKNGYFFSRR